MRQQLKRLENRTHRDDSRLTMKSQLIAIVAAVLVVGCGNPNDVLIQAVKDGNSKGISKAIADGADVNEKDQEGRTSLFSAKKKKIAELLISKGADVNTKMKGGWTPLHSTTSREVIEVLIAKGADINAKAGKGKNQGTTPLDYAIMWEHTAIADLLRKHGGKSGTEDSIHVAAALGNIEAIKQHLAVGADVNARKAHGGTTPLHRAASRGHKEVAELLIANGADVNQVAEMKRVDVSGNTTVKTTPLDFAKRHPEIADLLRKHGAKTGEELKAEGK